LGEFSFLSWKGCFCGSIKTFGISLRPKHTY
jgi:hypothetical protein